MSSTPEILSRVLAERSAQDVKWGVQRHPDGTGTPGSRALANNAKRICARAALAGVLTWSDILLEEVFEAFDETDPDKLVAELVQVAAVATAWAEDVSSR